MSVIDIPQLSELGSRPSTFQLRVSTVVDEMAYRLLRWFVLFMGAKIDTYSILIERSGAGMLCSGEIKLSGRQERDGWHITDDEAGYCYAYFREADADI
jgi:hypothetical protein